MGANGLGKWWPRESRLRHTRASKLSVDPRWCRRSCHSTLVVEAVAVRELNWLWDRVRMKPVSFAALVVEPSRTVRLSSNHIFWTCYLATFFTAHQFLRG